jgi:SAM-dependent methyltransferase
VKKIKNAVKTWSTPVAAGEREKIPCALCGGEQFVPALSCEGFSYVRCIRCDLVQMNPQPLGASVVNRYQDSHGNEYLSYELANEGNFLRLQELALSDARFFSIEKDYFAKIRRADNGVKTLKPRVLDVGCATGALLAMLRNRGWNCTGVEISPSAAYARGERGLEVSSLPLEENKYPENSFEVVLASHLIEHLNRPADFIREVYRVLAGGGRLFITTPNIAGFQAKLFGGRWRSAIFDHLYLFSAATLSSLLKNSGFRVEMIRTWGGLASGTAPLPVKRAADKAAKKFGFGDVMLIRALKAE